MIDKVSIIISRGSLDGVYPGLILANGARMISDTLEAAGFDVLYLGPDTPAAEVANAVRAHRPALVGLSVTMPSDLAALQQAIAAVAEIDPTVPVMTSV